MSQSGYTSWSVTAGEVPTTAMWNILGSNDASFNTGNGFNDGIILTRHIGAGVQVAPVESNPNKFSVYPSTAWTQNIKVAFDTPLFDTASSFNTSANWYVIPKSGFYQLSTWLGTAVTQGIGYGCYFYKNNTTNLGGGNIYIAPYTNAGGYNWVVGSGLYQFTVGDTVSVIHIGQSGQTGYSGQSGACFTGFMVSAT